VAEFKNPAIEEFTGQMGERLVWGEVLIRRKGEGFELRHARDERAADLKSASLEELRKIAGESADRKFRPLKSAPNLRGGWICAVRGPGELGRALNVLYPGSVADWFYARQPGFAAAEFRTFTARQTGMYRITHLLDEAGAASVIAETCRGERCLKERRWTAAGIETDRGKSGIPCLEPCPFVYEGARQAFRAARESSRAENPGEPPTPEKDQ
jgi:hypothetical protein